MTYNEKLKAAITLIGVVVVLVAFKFKIQNLQGDVKALQEEVRVLQKKDSPHADEHPAP